MTESKSLRARLCLLGVPAALAVALFSCSNAPPPPPVAATQSTAELAPRIQEFCTRCHAATPPDVLPRGTWRAKVQDMYRFVGLVNLPPPPPPPLEDVVRYFEERAPERPAEAVIVRASHPCPVAFERRTLPKGPDPEEPSRPGQHLSHMIFTALHDPKVKELVVCEMSTGGILALRPTDPLPAWRVLGRVAHPGHVEAIDLDGDGIMDLLVADLGNFPPTDRRDGAVVWLRGKKDGTYDTIPLLKDVGRVADVQAADFDGDGRLDLVVASFGWRMVGEVLVLLNRTTDGTKPTFEVRVVDKRHGAIHVPIVDLNGDGKPDFVALLSQEHEEIVGFLNDGNGTFTPKTIWKGPHPAYGSSGLQLVDLNGDGRLDLLYTNGDVMDDPFFPKAWHGVQWLENPGPGVFPWVHHPIAPLYGAHRAVAADIDGDGDLDILAVAYLPADVFPQREKLAFDAVVFFEQTAPGVFARHTLESGSCDHVSGLLADLYGTGRVDLVVGNFAGGPRATAPATVWKNLGRR